MDDVWSGSTLGPAPGGKPGGAGSVSPIADGGRAASGPSLGPARGAGARATAWALPRRAISSGSSIWGAGGNPSGAAGGGRRLGAGVGLQTRRGPVLVA